MNTIDTIKQENLMKIKKEIDMIHKIETNKESINFYIKEEDTSEEDNIIVLEIAMDITNIKDKTEYRRHINERLPRLHDKKIPSLLQDIAFLGPMLNVSISDWSVDRVEKGVELKQIENSIFFHQLKKHEMDQYCKKMYKELHMMWDGNGIPYNKRKKLLLVEI